MAAVNENQGLEAFPKNSGSEEIGDKSGTVAQSPTMILNASPERLVSAFFAAPSTIELTFADGLFLLPIDRLEIPVGLMQWTTVSVSPTGDALTVKGIKGEVVLIDASTLRYLIDKDYAAKTDATLKSLQFSREELQVVARDNPPPPEWFAQPERDLRRESWK